MRGVPTVAIVGGGCSGTLVAIHLLSDPGGSQEPLRIVMVERGAHVGRGVAYATTCDRHLLNVPAGDMSAYPDDPDHFVRWLRHHQLGGDARSFVRRSLYGAYLQGALGQAHRDAGRGRCLERVRGQVVDIASTDRRLRLTCTNSRALEADAVVLAPGNFAPRRPGAVAASALASERYVANPWGCDGLGRIPPEATVLLLGTGLTAMDVALVLREQGHRGPIHALSRHGLVPEAHRAPGPGAPPPLSDFAPSPPPPTARGILRELRGRSAEAEGNSGDWRAAIDGLRGTSNEIWARLPLVEQRRVLRHLRSYWNVHRHRMAPEVAAWIDELRTSGQLSIRAGRLDDCVVGPSGLRATIRGRPPASTEVLDIGYLVNCTGPETDVTRLADPFLDSLLAGGLACPDRLGMGLAVSTAGALIDREGQDTGRLWTIGSLRQGTAWETTAVPELRLQAAALAAQLATTGVSGGRVSSSVGPAGTTRPATTRPETTLSGTTLSRTTRPGAEPVDVDRYREAV